MLKIHFINVGHGDCSIIEFPSGRVAMVDINNASELDDNSVQEIYEMNSVSEQLYNRKMLAYKLGILDFKQLMEFAGYDIQLTNPIEYFKDNISNDQIFRFISTHPHMDHLTGLSLIKDNLLNIWITKNEFSQEDSKLSELQKEDWKLYKKYRSKIDEKVDGVTVISPKSGSQQDFYKQDGITVIAPNEELIKLAKEKNNPNIMSTVVVIQYGGHKIVLPGDAEKETWEYILENHEELISDITILKAAHHGRNSGYHKESVKKMSPQFTIVSVGKKPSTDASNKYRNFSKNVFSTRWKGNIIFTINEDGTGEYHTEYNR